MASAQERYDNEQLRLKAQYEGESDEQAIVAPVEPEVNPAVYKDVESLLYRGFLIMFVDLNGVSFVFKNLNHHEFDFLKCYGDTVPEDFWGTFLAYGVFMVDGVNILPERDAWVGKLVSTFKGLPSEAMTRIVNHLSELNRRASVATHMTEAYVMELVSRYRWLQLKNLDLTSVAVTGIDGTQRLGLNIAQQTWRAFNHIEDRNEGFERDWEYAKFVGACFAGKGVAKVYSADARRHRQEREDRMTRKDRILRQWVLGEEPKEGVVKIPGAEVTVARTVPELAVQLEKDIRGEKDWHDQIVQEHEARIKARHLERRQQAEQAVQDSLERFPTRGVVGGGSLEQTFTLTEVEERVRRRKQLMAQEAARMQRDPESEERMSRFMDRWVDGDQISSQVSTTDRDPSEAVAIPPQRPLVAAPFRRK